jgi:hypothetical protein
MVQDYSTINILDQFEATHYRLLITVLPIHSCKITPWQPHSACRFMTSSSEEGKV